MFINALPILANFQMTETVTVPVQKGIESEITSHDPFLPTNNTAGIAGAMFQLSQGGGGWDDVNHAQWITTIKVPIGSKILFYGKTWTVVGIDDYESTSFTNAVIYKLQEANTLKNKEVVPSGKWN